MEAGGVQGVQGGGREIQGNQETLEHPDLRLAGGTVSIGAPGRRSLRPDPGGAWADLPCILSCSDLSGAMP